MSKWSEEEMTKQDWIMGIIAFILLCVFLAVAIPNVSAQAVNTDSNIIQLPILIQDGIINISHNSQTFPISQNRALALVFGRKTFLSQKNVFCARK